MNCIKVDIVLGKKVRFFMRNLEEDDWGRNENNRECMERIWYDSYV